MYINYTGGDVCKYTIMGGIYLHCVHKNQHFDQAVKIDMVRDRKFLLDRKKQKRALNITFYTEHKITI